MKATGKGTEEFLFYDGKKPFSTEVPKPPKEPRPVEPADVIEGKHDGRGSLVRAQTKFAKDIRAMMEGHANRNTVIYILSLQAKKQRLLAEKLRRLRLADPECGESQ